MSDDCPPKNPRIIPPVPPAACDPGPSSLTERLARTVNAARQLNTTYGLRMYRVFSVRRHWSGGEVGRGDMRTVSERELLPRPKVDFRTRRELTPSGWQERGVVVISEINPQLTEDEVLSLFSSEQASPGDESFTEIVMDSRDGASVRRRCIVVEPPRRMTFSWTVTLREQDSARTRSGATSYPGKR